MSVAIGRSCFFYSPPSIESNLFCRKVHFHTMPAKNGVICTIRGYDFRDPLDGLDDTFGTRKPAEWQLLIDAGGNDSFQVCPQMGRRRR